MLRATRTLQDFAERREACYADRQQPLDADEFIGTFRRELKINGAQLATPLWRDTFVLTRSSGDSFTSESKFVDYTGTFVQHCRVLLREDLGMTSSIEAIP